VLWINKDFVKTGFKRVILFAALLFDIACASSGLYPRWKCFGDWWIPITKLRIMGWNFSVSGMEREMGPEILRSLQNWLCIIDRNLHLETSMIRA
jgi:hypothetical protein